MPDFIQIHPRDHVAVALRDIAPGTEFCGVTAKEKIPQGHKMSLKNLMPGSQILKYGCSIGHAVRRISAGEWVHTHNMETGLLGFTEYHYQPDLKKSDPVKINSFTGYRRKDHRVGIRNEIWIIPAVGCVNDVAKLLASENQDLVSGTIDGIYAFPHPYGCSQTGEDHARTRKLLAALARHPNAGAVLIVGLGCENLTRRQFEDELGDEYDPDRIRFLICQETEDEVLSGRKMLEACASYAGQFRRQEIPGSELIVGMKCGGSDGLSGITGNPAVGRFSDLLIAGGGTGILTEVPEMFGAEQLLLNRCVSRKVFEQAAEMLNGWKNYYILHHEKIYENPSPGNKQGGITTLEEKSCGCVQKGGTATISAVLKYGDRVTEKGLNLLSGPGNDLVSASALTAAGAHIILFTTGRGTPFGAPAPTLKISTNSDLAKHKKHWIDWNAGGIADGSCTLDEAAKSLMQLVLETASGKKTKAEECGFREISILKDGVTL